MRRLECNRDGQGPCRRRRGAAGVLALLFAAAMCIGAAGNNPLGPLRFYTRVSLEWRGARFQRDASPRLQASLVDCGPTALAALLELSGHRVPGADTIRLLASTTARGTSISAIQVASATLGLELFRVHWDPNDLAKLPLPALLWVERNHFVVVAHRDTTDSVDVLDPATGRYRMASNRFSRLWSGEALIEINDMAFRREQDQQSGQRPLRSRGTRAVRS